MGWLVVGVVLLIVAAALVLVRRSQQAKLRDITGTETTSVRELAELAQYVSQEMDGVHAFSRMVEVKGTIKCDQPLISEIARQPCVYYAMKVTREFEETYWDTDSRSHNRVRRTRRGSDTVASNSQRVEFFVEDASGRLRVDPTGADIDAVKVVDKYEPAEQQAGGPTLTFGGLSLNLGGMLTASGSHTLGYRSSESILPLDRRVYVLGEASDASGELKIQASREKGKRFIISLRSEEELVRSAESTIRWLFYSAVACGVLGVLAIVAGLFSR